MLGSFHLIREEANEHCPTRISNVSVETLVFVSIFKLHKPLSIQVLNDDKPVLVDELPARLMKEVSTLTTNLPMNRLNALFGLTSGGSTALLLGEPFLRLFEFRKRFIKMTRVFNNRAIRKRSELGKAEVDTNSPIRMRKRFHRNLVTRKRDIPVFSFTFDGRCFDSAFNFPMFPDTDKANLGETDFLVAEPDGAIVRLGIGKAVVSVDCFEPGKPGFFPFSLESAEKGQICPVNSANHVLKNLGIDGGIFWKLTKFGKLSMLAIAGKRLLACSPSIAFLFKSGVVKLLTVSEKMDQQLTLPLIWIQPEFEGFAHGFFSETTELYHKKNGLSRKKQEKNALYPHS